MPASRGLWEKEFEIGKGQELCSWPFPHDYCSSKFKYFCRLPSGIFSAAIACAIVKPNSLSIVCIIWLSYYA